VTGRERPGWCRSVGAELGVRLVFVTTTRPGLVAASTGSWPARQVELGTAEGSMHGTTTSAGPSCVMATCVMGHESCVTDWSIDA
jgi:hypothetical protein